jgi:hypothetical protein
MLKSFGNHMRSNVVGYVALFIALGGTTYAATGGNFILGQSNSASSTTSLTRTGANTGKGLQVTNNSTGAGATALGLNVAGGHAPFTVNSGTKVANLNADKVDGQDASALLGAHAYGHISSSASFGPSKNITGVSNPASGFFCLSFGGGINAATATAVVTPDYTNDATAWTTDGPQSIAEVADSNGSCPSGTLEVQTGYRSVTLSGGVVTSVDLHRDNQGFFIVVG